jgi:hypothetical protein
MKKISTAATKQSRNFSQQKLTIGLATVGDSAGEKPCPTKNHRTLLTPTGLLMEGHYTQNPSLARTATHIYLLVTIEDGLFFSYLLSPHSFDPAQSSPYTWRVITTWPLRHGGNKCHAGFCQSCRCRRGIVP